MKNSVVMVNEASNLLGMGHILRSQVLAKILHGRGYNIKGLTIGEEKAVLYAQVRCANDHFEWPILRFENAQDAITHIQQEESSLFLIDCSIATQEILSACAFNEYLTVALDYFIYDNILPAALINLIDQSTASAACNSSTMGGAKYYEGPNYAIIRDEILNIRKIREKKNESKSVKNILISFGGADPVGNTRHALKLIYSWQSIFNVTIIVGPLFSHENTQFEIDIYKNLIISIKNSPNYVGDFFLEADLLFCGGGGTLLEALCVGLPTIVIAQNVAEYRHASFFAKRNACWLSDQFEWGIVSQYASRKKTSECSKKLVDGKGAERICNIIEKLMRKAIK